MATFLLQCLCRCVVCVNNNRNNELYISQLFRVLCRLIIAKIRRCMYRKRRDSNWYSSNGELTAARNQATMTATVLLNLFTIFTFITAAMGAICSTTVPVGTPLYWSTDSRPVWVGWDGMASVVDGRRIVAGKLTKKKLDKDCSQHTRI